MGEFNTKIVAEFTPPKTWVLEKALSFQTDQLNDEDIQLLKIIGVNICKDNQDIVLGTKLGKCIRFEAEKLRVFKGRSSKGIKAVSYTHLRAHET